MTLRWPSTAFGGLLVPPLALAGGSLIFLVVVVIIFFAVAYGYYTVRGSGISQTPYRGPDGPPESPSELAHDITQEVGNWERGTEGHHGRHRPATAREPTDPLVAEALRRWRRGAAPIARLEPPIGPTDHVTGPADVATVTIYVDLASEPCRGACLLLADLARQRPLRIAVRHLPLADVHALALPAAESLEAAGAQGAFFELLDRLARAAPTDEATLLESASGSVPDPERLLAEVADGLHRARVIAHIGYATESGVSAIPEVFIEREHYAGVVKNDALSYALDEYASR
jgi:hypothetical protein